MEIFSFIVTLFWGILAGVITAVLVMYLINNLMNTPKWLIGAVGTFLFFFLSFQFTAMIGAGKVKDLVADVAMLSNTVSGKADWNVIIDEYPILKPYLNQVDTTLAETGAKKASVLSYINSTINGYMWRRAAWALGGLVVCFVIALVSDSVGGARGKEIRRVSPSTLRTTARPRPRPHSHRR